MNQRSGEEIVVDAEHDRGRSRAVEEVVAELDHVRGVVVAVDALVVVIIHGGCLTWVEKEVDLLPPTHASLA